VKPTDELDYRVRSLDTERLRPSYVLEDTTTILLRQLIAALLSLYTTPPDRETA
jgi:hypothetical protein